MEVMAENQVRVLSGVNFWNWFFLLFSVVDFLSLSLLSLPSSFDFFFSLQTNHNKIIIIILLPFKFNLVYFSLLKLGLI